MKITLHCISQHNKNRAHCNVVQQKWTYQHGVYTKEDSSDNQRKIALKNLEKGLTRKNLAEKFSIPQNTYWIKHMEDTISKYASGQFGAKKQKLSVGKHDSVDKAVYKCFAL